MQPPTNGITTSNAAAVVAMESAQLKRDLILATIKAHPEGLTDEQIQDLTGIPGSTERPRRGELSAAGLVEVGGIASNCDTVIYQTRKTKSGCNALVWFAV